MDEIVRTIEFAKIISQVVPILILGITIQSGVLATLNRKKLTLKNYHILTTTGVFGLLSYVEYLSLRVIQTGTINEDYLSNVYTVLLIAIIYIYFDFIFALKKKSHRFLQITDVVSAIAAILALIINALFLRH